MKDQAINIPDVMQEPRHYGMHRHFTAAGSVLMFGGGMKKGFLYGKTADERPCTTTRTRCRSKTCTPRSSTRWASRPNRVCQREAPVYVTRDGKGKAVKELFA